MLDEIEGWFYDDEQKTNKWWKIKLLNEETIGYVYAPLATLDEVKHPVNCLVEKLLHPSGILDSHYQRYGLFWQVETGSAREDALVYASNKWYDLRYGSRTIPGLVTAICEEAFLIWDRCLENNGYGRANSVTIVDEFGTILATVHRNIITGAIDIDFSY